MPEDFTPQDGENGSSAFDEFLARYLDGERARASRSIDLTRFLSLRTQEFLQQAGAVRARARPARTRRPPRAARPGRRVAGQGRRRAHRRRSGARSPAPSSSGCRRRPDPADVDGAVITPSVQRALFHAFQVARSSGSTYVDPEHLFFALVLGQDAPAGQILAQAGVTADALAAGRARDRHAERCDRRPSERAGCRGIRDPDARPVRHRPDRARPGQARSTP